MVITAQMDFSTMSMGQIHQFTLEVVDKLCRQHQYFSNIMNRKAKYTRACKKPYLEIKCREKACHCSPKKKKAIQTQTKEKKRPLKFSGEAKGEENPEDKDVSYATRQDILQKIVQKSHKKP